MTEIYARIVKNAFGRYVIVNGRNIAFAWSDAGWVPHHNGVSTRGVQVSNFGTWDEAEEEAWQRGMVVLNDSEKRGI
jgi:hypothetical protein